MLDISIWLQSNAFMLDFFQRSFRPKKNICGLLKEQSSTRDANANSLFLVALRSMDAPLCANLEIRCLRLSQSSGCCAADSADLPMIVIMKQIPLSCGDCCGGGTAPLLEISCCAALYSMHILLRNLSLDLTSKLSA